ncbi:hypothetical protein PSGK_21205 [Pseudomonas solani]|uniref:hypothetical protein n=1 Tax=Pseudomonas solani TaxID=2731552 RepID=UPI0035BE3DE2
MGPITDHRLLEETLVNLLRMPRSHWTREQIKAHLSLAATAAALDLARPSTLQMEHMKLAAAVELLAGGMGEGFSYRVALRSGPNLEGIELFASVESKGGGADVRFTGFGSTAERVLAQLRDAISVHGKALATKPTKPREANRNPLRLLPRKARTA